MEEEEIVCGNRCPILDGLRKVIITHGIFMQRLAKEEEEMQSTDLEIISIYGMRRRKTVHILPQIIFNPSLLVLGPETYILSKGRLKDVWRRTCTTNSCRISKAYKCTQIPHLVLIKCPHFYSKGIGPLLVIPFGFFF